MELRSVGASSGHHFSGLRVEIAEEASFPRFFASRRISTLGSMAILS